MNISIPREMNASTFFLDHNLEQGRGDKVAVYFGEQTYTYAELLANSSAIGNALLDLGVQVGNRVVMLVKDSPDFVCTFFGAIRMGAVPVPVNTFLTEEDYMFILNDSRAKVLVANQELIPFIESRLAELPFLQHVIFVDHLANNQAEAKLSLASIYTDYSGNLEPVVLTADDMAYWLYSSGTTGFPKGVVHLQHDLLCCNLYGQGVLNFSEDDIVFATSKSFFAYGLGNGIHIPFANGGSTVFLKERPTMEAIADILVKHRPTIFFSVPTFYSSILRAGLTKDVFASVRCFVSAGEALSADIFHKWQETMAKPILEGFGSTEVTYMVLSNTIGQETPLSAGKVVPGNEAKIVNDQGAECEPNQVGRLLIKAESTAAYYWNQHQKTKETFLGEWLDTGDLFYKDEQGNFFNVGRNDDLIKSSGIWVYPLEVEKVIKQHPAVEEVAVVGEEDQEGLVKVVAYIKLEEGHWGTDIKETLMTFMREQLPGFKCPKTLLFVEELPRTNTGKLMRYKLREQGGAHYATKQA